MTVRKKCFLGLIGITQSIKRIPVQNVFDKKCGDHQIANARNVFGKERPCFVLPRSIFVHETFQKFCLLDEIRIEFPGGFGSFVGQFAEGVKGLKKRDAAFLNQGQEFFYRNNSR